MRSIRASAEEQFAQVQDGPVKKTKKTKEVKYSDELANGDPTDDKEIEDIKDPRDPIVDDVGFVN